MCRFFLRNAGPLHTRGGQRMVPFVINMASLFETFVASWLGCHGPPSITSKAQEAFIWDQESGANSKIDLLMADATTGRPLAVLDTKYKVHEEPSPADVHQIVFYALNVGCREAVLVYPEPLAHPLDTHIKGIHLRTLSFDLSGDLDRAGWRFSGSLFGKAVVPSPGSPLFPETIC